MLLHSESVDNHTNYANPEVDDLLEQARTEQDQAKRFDLYNRAEKLIVADAPWIPLWHGDSGLRADQALRGGLLPVPNGDSQVASRQNHRKLEVLNLETSLPDEVGLPGMNQNLDGVCQHG